MQEFDSGSFQQWSPIRNLTAATKRRSSNEKRSGSNLLYSSISLLFLIWAFFKLRSLALVLKFSHLPSVFGELIGEHQGLLYLKLVAITKKLVMGFFFMIIGINGVLHFFRNLLYFSFNFTDIT